MLNYHHLRYFSAVAHEGNLTRAAEKLNLSQSALSTQIKALEARLGQALFDRVGRQLVLTEVGRIALDHADRIFATGAELEATLAQTSTILPPFRVGALSTLSRNFQMQFLRPVLARGGYEVILRSGGPELLETLGALGLDVVLTTEPPQSGSAGGFTTHRIASQRVGLHGAAHRLHHKTLFDLLSNEPLILPMGAIRMGFDSLIARLGIKPEIVAEADDMAMVRLLAREDAGVALAPDVVLADEIASGRLATAPFDLELTETFYAITAPRNFPHPLLAELLG
ncbi:LysR family transcriptional regulator [uncultured Sulfitobacter sp.]|uniref:LysR family transcriptional regulator n=1 Tax=uncultured Sulfitobacter sp. TaxID=191468 RepID=UPI00261CFEA9|nr:LysR family transcriptional regulator [uncultured Sulfitobacter sp.]